MKVITFSEKFPAYHPQAGEKTFFAEKIWKGLPIEGEYTIWSKYPRLMKSGEWQVPHLWRDMMLDKKFTPKYHTIRAGQRWKAGDWFSPRVWSAKPYASKQIEFAPQLQIKKTFGFEMHPFLWFDECEYFINGKRYGGDELTEVAKNDGLGIMDFACWFAGPNAASTKRKSFVGQIICWDESINY